MSCESVTGTIAKGQGICQQGEPCWESPCWEAPCWEGEARRAMLLPSRLGRVYSIPLTLPTEGPFNNWKTPDPRHRTYAGMANDRPMVSELGAPVRRKPHPPEVLDQKSLTLQHTTLRSKRQSPTRLGPLHPVRAE